MARLSTEALEKIATWLPSFSPEDLEELKNMVDADFLRRNLEGYIDKIPRKKPKKSLLSYVNMVYSKEHLNHLLTRSKKRAYSYKHNFSKKKKGILPEDIKAEDMEDFEPTFDSGSVL